MYNPPVGLGVAVGGVAPAVFKNIIDKFLAY